MSVDEGKDIKQLRTHATLRTIRVHVLIIPFKVRQRGSLKLTR